MSNILRSIRRLLDDIGSTFRPSEDTGESQIIRDDTFEDDSPLETFEFRQKFVSGLFYCGGQRKQFFARTFEQNSTIREKELLNMLEAEHDNCSNIRDNFGYSDDFIDRSEVQSAFIYPDIETGEL